MLAEARPEHVLFSFHGLPERQVKKSDPTGAHCLARADCCDARVPANRWCYRMQSFHTARELAQRLGLEVGTWTVTFQSRLGRTPWIKPYTDLVIPELAGKGVKRLAVFCPAFVADCLETLEEIGIPGEDQFLAPAARRSTLVPSLNAHPSWVRGLTQMLRELRGEEVWSPARRRDRALRAPGSSHRDGLQRSRHPNRAFRLRRPRDEPRSELATRSAVSRREPGMGASGRRAQQPAVVATPDVGQPGGDLGGQRRGTISARGTRPRS